MNFHFFVQTIKDILYFVPGKEWDEDEWNVAYIDFKNTISTWSEEWKLKKTDSQLICEWAKEWFCDATIDTHNYELK